MPTRNKTEYLVVHVTATRPSQDIGRAEIDAMHKARGWAGIGYHRVIRRDGRVEQGRPDDEIGAHVEGFNSISWGISLVGGLDANGKPANTMTPAQEQTLLRELKAASAKYPNAKVCGHRDLSPDKDGDGMITPTDWTKECPCFDAIPWAKANGLPAANIRGQWDSKAPARPTGPDERTAYLQRLLARAGFSFGAIDGIVGPKTREAIKKYQAANGLLVTGEFDPATVAHLRNRFENPGAAIPTVAVGGKPAPASRSNWLAALIAWLVGLFRR